MTKEIAPTWELVEDDGSGIGFEERARLCRERIEQANKNINVGFYDLAVGLYEAARYDYVRAWGFVNLEDYADQVLGFGRRKAYNFVECGKAISEIPGLSRERVEAVGWSKLSLIAPKLLLLPARSEEYLELAETSSYRELKDQLRSMDVDTEREEKEPSEVFYLKSAKVDGESAVIVEKALQSAADMYNLKVYGDIITRICADWLMVHGEVADSTLQDWINFIEKQFAVRVLVKSRDEERSKAIEDARKAKVEDYEQNFLKSVLSAESNGETPNVPSVKVVPKDQAYAVRKVPDTGISDDELDALLS